MKRLLLAAVLALSATSVSAAPVTYKIDPNHTVVLASWSHFGFSHPVANFGQADGAIVFDADHPAASHVEVTLPLAGLDGLVPAFTEHLRSADFFDAEHFPTASFKSTRVESTGDGHFRITGELTIKGITKPVVLDAILNKHGTQPQAQRDAIGFDATATVKRSDFDVAKYVPNVSDEITLRITTEAVVPKPQAAN